MTKSFLLILFLSCFSGAYPEHTLKIVLSPESQIDRELFTLKDIAALQADDPDLIARAESLTLGHSSVPGYSRLLSQEQLKTTLHRALGDHFTIQISGPERIKISTAYQEIGEIQIKEACRAYLFHEMPWRKEKVTLLFTAVPQQMIIPKLPYSIRVENKGYRFRGPGQLEVKVFSEQRVVKTTVVSVYLKVYENVLVAANKLKRNSIIAEEALKFELKEISKIPGELFFHPNEIVGKQLKRSVNAGRVLDASMVEEPPLVKRGESVELIVQSGSIQLRTPGIARQNGGLGEMIRVKNLKNRQIVQAKVLSAEQVELKL